jgi:hypothetical protein
MRDPVKILKDQTRDRCTPRPDRSEVAAICLQSGLVEGLSMEWVFDRFEQSDAQVEGRK